MIDRVGILGGGAWGTALAFVAASAGRSVTIWARDPSTVAGINDRRENPRRLPGVVLPDTVTAAADLAAAADADAVLAAVPAQAFRDVMTEAAPVMRPGTPLVQCAKGLDRATGLLLSQVLEGTAPRMRAAALSGPGFAADVAAGLPTAVTVAAGDGALAGELCRALATPAFRPYAETDLIGVEIGGAVKNVLAIAVGIVAGRGLGASASAAAIARGFAELRRLGGALGAEPETLMGLSGLGDLVLTCTSGQSRNFAFGERLGRGEPDDTGALVEGVPTAAAARDLARRLDVEMPIVEAVAAVLAGGLSVDAAIEGLLARPLRHERD